MKDELNNPHTKKSADKVFRQSLLQSTRLNHLGSKNGYSALIDEPENDNQAFVADQTQRQQMIIEQQDEQLSLVADSVGILKNMSQSIGNELDEQTVILNDLGNEMDSTQHKMDTLLRKMAKVTHMSDDRRQWCAIGVLGSSMFAIFILFFIL
jgi:syntaxin 6